MTDRSSARRVEAGLRCGCLIRAPGAAGQFQTLIRHREFLGNRHCATPSTSVSGGDLDIRLNHHELRQDTPVRTQKVEQPDQD